MEEVTVYPLSNILATKLEFINFLTTEDGLSTLRGLSGFREFRRHIKCIILSPLRPYIWTIPNVNEATQVRYEEFASSPKAHQLLVDIFMSLADAPNLTKINIGYDEFCSSYTDLEPPSIPCWGIKALARAISDGSDESYGSILWSLRVYYCARYCPKAFPKGLGLLLRALRDSRFSSSRVAVRLVLDERGMIEVSPADAQLMAQDCIRDLTLDIQAHRKINSENVGPGSDARWLRRCLHEATNVEILYIRGWQDSLDDDIEGQELTCSSCKSMMRPFYDAPFPRLVDIRLENIHTTQKDLLEFMRKQAQRGLMKSVYLYNVSIDSYGLESWRPILQLMLQIPSLEKVRAEILCVLPEGDDGSARPYVASDAHNDEHWDYDGVEGRDEVVRYLTKLSASI
jgi:hypothetical protein